MSTFNAIFDRVKFATGTRTQIELAEVLEIRQSSISDAKRRNSIPADWYMKLFEKFGLNPDWMKSGDGPMYLRTEHGYEAVDDKPEYINENMARYGSSPDAKPSVVTVHSMSSSNLEDAGSLKGVGKIALPQSFVSSGVQVLLLDSTGMEPFIRKGAYIGVDTTQKQIVSGELYGVNLPFEGISVKRVFLDSGRKQILLRSENTVHPEQDLPLDKHQDVIVGRVVWVLQRL